MEFMIIFEILITFAILYGGASLANDQSAPFRSLAEEKFTIRWEGTKLQAIVMAAVNCNNDVSSSIDGDLNRVRRAAIDTARQQSIRRVMLTRGGNPDPCMSIYGNEVEYADYVNQNVDSVWVNHYGQLVGVDRKGSLLSYDPNYYSDRPEDDDTPIVLSNYFQIGYKELQLKFEIGSFLTNGEVCLVSSRVGEANGKSSDQAIEEYFNTELDCKKTVVVPHLKGLPTGHIDMYMTFATSKTLVISQYANKTDSVNSAIQQKAIDKLKKLNLFNIVVVPQPTNCPAAIGQIAPATCPGVALEDRVWRTFTSLFHIGNTVIAPLYNDLGADDEYFSELRSILLDNMKGVLQIDITSLIKQQAGIRSLLNGVPG